MNWNLLKSADLVILAVQNTQPDTSMALRTGDQPLMPGST